MVEAIVNRFPNSAAMRNAAAFYGLRHNMTEKQVLDSDHSISVEATNNKLVYIVQIGSEKYTVNLYELDVNETRLSLDEINRETGYTANVYFQG